MKMKWLVPLCVAASVAVIALADNTPGGNTAPNSNEIQSLRSEVSELRSRVQSLEDRTQQLQSQMEKLTQPRLMPLFSPGTNRLFVNPPSTDSGRGKTWGQKEVNGWTFYVVPCEQQGP